MIHNNSTDPVLIKKISLKIWSLRDEIESRIKEKVDSGVPLKEVDMEQIRKLYTPKTSVPNNVLELKPNDELDSGEDEMAKAMAAAEAEEAGLAEAESAPIEEIKAEEATAETASIIEPTNDNKIEKDLSPTIAVIPPEKISKGKTVLSEISMEKMFFFCNKAYTEGQSVVIEFCIPKSFIVNADILYCRPFNLKSRIISQNNYTHRVLIRFNFLKDGERTLLRQFLQSIEPDLSKVVKKIEKPKDDEGFSGFDDLEDLGL